MTNEEKRYWWSVKLDAARNRRVYHALSSGRLTAEGCNADAVAFHNWRQGDTPPEGYRPCRRCLRDKGAGV